MEEEFNCDDFIAEVDLQARSEKLIEEFQEHWAEVSSQYPHLDDQKQEVFSGWAIQKIAALELCILHLQQRLINFETVLKTLID